jgi:hypothetical protein
MEGRIAVNVSVLDSRLSTARHIGEKNLEDSIVASHTGLHDGISASYIATENSLWVGLSQEMDNLGMAETGGKHQSCLVVVIEGRRGDLVTQGDEGFADQQMAKAGSEMEARVGKTVRGVVGIMDEVGMGLDDALD